MGDRSHPGIGKRWWVVLIVCDDLAWPTWLPLLRRRRRRRRGARSCRRFSVIGVFVGVWLGVLGGTTAFALGRGIYAFFLSLSLWAVWESERENGE